MSTRHWILVVLGLALGVGLTGCDYGVAEWEDPAAVDEEGIENLESWDAALRGEGEDLDAERRESITGGAPSALLGGYVVAPSSAGANPSAPVAHPDPKPWKGK